MDCACYEDQIYRRNEELASIRDGILTGIDQIEQGELADGTDAEAIDRAFDNAKRKRGL